MEELEEEKNKLFNDITQHSKASTKPLKAVNNSQVLLNKRIHRNVELLSPQSKSFLVYKSNSAFEKQLKQ